MASASDAKPAKAAQKLSGLARRGASGEPPTGCADMLTVRDGVPAADPHVDGPLQVRGNLEIVSGTGRAVVRVTSTRLCRCGASGNKPVGERGECASAGELQNSFGSAQLALARGSRCCAA